MRLLKKPEVLRLTAKSNTTHYSDINEGLMVPPVILGKNSVAWPEYEIIAINAARIAAKSNDEIKNIVAKLIKLRKVASGKSESELRTTITNLLGGV